LGEYGIPEPNKAPYKVVYRTVSDAKKRMGEDFKKLRPYLQDFSLFGVHYGPEQVKAQIQACNDLGVQDWLLWNPNSRFTKAALRPKGDSSPDPVEGSGLNAVHGDSKTAHGEPVEP
jgi:hypothetical protein